MHPIVLVELQTCVKVVFCLVMPTSIATHVSWDGVLAREAEPTMMSRSLLCDIAMPADRIRQLSRQQEEIEEMLGGKVCDEGEIQEEVQRVSRKTNL